MLLLLSYEIDVVLKVIDEDPSSNAQWKEHFEEELNRDSLVRESHHDWLPPSVGNQEYQHWAHQFGGS